MGHVYRWGMAAWIVVAFSISGIAEPVRGRVIHVADGDTLTVLWNGEPRVIRIQGIDAPETGQPFGAKAAWVLKALVLDRTVTLRPYEHDRYGRMIADVESGGRNVALALVEQGLAYHYTRYSSDSALAVAEQKARQARVGLWSQASPIPPWEYREQQRTITATREGDHSSGMVIQWGVPVGGASWESKLGSFPAPSAGKEVFVRGYYRKDGTHVKPHWRYNPGHKKD